MNSLSAGHVKDEITQEMQSKVHFYNNQLETEIIRLISLIQEFSTNVELEQLSNSYDILDPYQKKDTILKVQKGLSIFKSASSYVLEASIHIPSIGRTLTTKAFDPLNQDEYHAVNTVNNIYATPIITWNERLFISFPYPLKTKAIPTQYVIDIEISKSKLQETLQTFTIDGGAVLISQENSWQVDGHTDDTLRTVRWSQQFAVDQDSGVARIKLAAKTFMVVYERSKVLGTNLIMYEPEQAILGPLQLYRVWLWIMSVLSLIVILIASYMIFRLIHKPLRNLVSAFRKVEQGNLLISLSYTGHDEFNYLYSRFNEMVRNIQQMIYEVYEYKYQTQHAELKQLQSQINPHFLYNSLFIASSLAKKTGDDTLIKLLKHLTDFFQFITRSSQDEVTLGEEVQHMRNYVEIQTLRFAKQISVELDDLPTELVALHVPRLILQPIVENAYKYGLESNAAGGFMQIHFIQNHTTLHIIIEDNGMELSDEALSDLSRKLANIDLSQETTGLLNVHRRMRLKFGELYGLEITRSSKGGLKVILTIPLPKESDLHV